MRPKGISGKVDGLRIATLYGELDAPVPRLSMAAVRKVGEFFAANDYVMIAGYIPQESGMPLRKVLALREYSAPHPGEETIVGPHILDISATGEKVYYSGAVGVWERQQTADPAAAC